MAGNEQLPHGTLLCHRYQILCAVGHGGMGNVYKAFDVCEKRIVAIKEMRESGFSAQEMETLQRSFEQEIALLRNLTPREHLPTIYESFYENDRSYFVMDFIEGVTLKQLIKNSPTGQLPVQNVLAYAIQLCEILSYLHGRSVVFRDLKPDNVMVTADGAIYLIDFGIARIFKSSRLTDTDLFESKGFTPPELFLERKTERRSDLYSLGATLHYCLTGLHPMHNQPNLFSFPLVRTFNIQGVPVALDNLIHWLVATNKGDRPESAARAQEALIAITQQAGHATETLSLEAGRTPGEYYNASIAQRAQLTFWLDRWNRLPGLLGRLWEKMTPIFAWIGAQVLLELYGVPSFCKRIWHILQHIDQGTRSFLSAAWHHVKTRMQVPYQRWRNRRRHAPPHPNLPGPAHLPSFIRTLVIMAGGSILLLAIFHLSPYVILFILAGILMLCALVGGVREHVENSTQNILATSTIAMMVVSGVLLTHPDVQSFVTTITLREILSWALLALSCAPLFCPPTRAFWVDHLAISLTALVCAGLQVALGPLEMPAALALPVDVGAAIILGGFALFSLSHWSKPFKRSDWWLLLFIAICPFIQQSLLGTLDLAFLFPGFSWSYVPLNILLLVALVVALLIAFFISDEPEVGNSPEAWLRLRRLPLLLIVVLCTLLLLLATNSMASGSSTHSLDFLSTRILGMAHTDEGIVAGLFLLAGIFIYSLVRRSNFLVVSVLASIMIAGVSALFLLAGNSQILFSLFNINTDGSQVLLWTALIVLALTIVSTILHLISSPREDAKLLVSIDLLLKLIKSGLIGLSLVACWLLTTSSGPLTAQDFATNFIQQGMSQARLMPLLFLMSVIACKLLYISFRLLSLLFRENIGARQERVFRGERHVIGRAWDILKDDCFVMLIMTVYLLVWWYMAGKPSLAHTPLLLWSTQITLPLPSWFIVGSLIIALGASFFWLQCPLSSETFRSLRFLLGIACFSIVVAGVGVVIAQVPPVFVIGAAAALILLIQAMLVVMWAEEEARPNPHRDEDEDWLPAY